MVVAIGVTIATPGVVSPWLIVGGLVIGGAIGAVVALRIQMTALPQLVAAFHSLVGLAAVFVAAAAFVSPDAFGIGAPGNIKTQSLIEMGLGTIIGAITFTGSIVAFAKLQGLVSGAPLIFRGQHPLNAAARHRPGGAAGVVRHARPSHHLHPADRAVAGAGLPADPADRRRRHAGRGVDAQLLFGMGGGRHRLHPGQHRADRDRRAGRLARARS